MEIFAVGDRVSHFIFGAGEVVAVDGQDRVSVKFDDGQTKWLMAQHAKLERLSADEASCLSEEEDIFVFEQVEGSHSMGAHWSPFFEDFSEHISVHLPSMLREAGLANSVSRLGVSKPLPNTIKLCWPQTQQDAVHFVLDITEQENALQSLFPVISRGAQETLAVSTLYVWKGGVEAQIEAKISNTEITFFDTDFVNNVGWYRKHMTAEFILAGLAYKCELANEPDMVLSDDHPIMVPLKKAAELQGKDVDSVSNIVSFKGMAVLMPIPEWDRDDYQFRGTIKEMRPYSMLDQDGWLLTVCVMRDLDENDRELNLNILVTKQIWKEKTPPQVGDDVRGTLWLQGRLWAPPRS